MNIKHAYTYDIGLDIGTNSIGWSVTDEDGKLMSYHKRPTMGVRLFKSAETAENRRMKRTNRRRMARTRMRIGELQRIFAPMIADVDSEFYKRLRASELVSEELHHGIGLFAGDDYTDADYYREFPTIFHLRKFLMETDDKQDIRLIYLALHNIMKRRGNFLREGNKNLSAHNANPHDALVDLQEALNAFSESFENSTFDIEIDVDAANNLLMSDECNVKELIATFSCTDFVTDDGMTVIKKSKIVDAFARACLGKKANIGNMFLNGMQLSLETKNSDNVEEVISALESDVLIDVVNAVSAVYNAYVLYKLLDGADSISAALVRKYEKHHDELQKLKYLFRKYCTKEEYDKIFRGEKFVNPSTGNRQYRLSNVTGYTQYIAAPGTYAKKKGKNAQDALISDIKAIFDKHPSVYVDTVYHDINQAIESGTLLSKPRSTDNGTIPYQLNLEEALAIIDRQGRYYPVLVENRQLISDMISKRIPYYVGPLHSNADGRSKNSWSVRLEGHENDRVFPWNYDEVIDTDASAELFIRRMTGKCTYLYGEDVLPRHSLLYSEFCLRNEMNCARFSDGGGKPHRMNNADDRQLMIDKLFKTRKKVTKKAVCNFLTCHLNYQNPDIVGTQSDNGFESKLESYNDYCKIFSVNDLVDAPLKTHEIEELILWQTIFEDKAIVERKVRAKYGDRLTDDQIAKIANKRYKGWGRLSRKLLSGIRTSNDDTGCSIIQIMRNDARTLQEIVTDDKIGIKNSIAAANEASRSDDSEDAIEELMCSPNTKRGIRQALKVIDEIIGIAGKMPRSINIEVTRDDQPKGKRTQSRDKIIKTMCKTIRDEIDKSSDLQAEIEQSGIPIDDDRLFLYVSQNCKDMYTGQSLNINELSSYQIDHIIPRSLIKDDSLDNKVLVRQSSNQRKGNRLGIDADIVTKMHWYWKMLAKNGLISQKKLRNLEMNVDDRKVVGRFINRQLVETASIVRHVREICQTRYETTTVVSVKASLSSNIRQLLGLTKCRTLNHYHHAHDALLATTVARFIQAWFPYLYDDGEFRWSDNVATQKLYGEIRKRLSGNDTRGYQIAGYLAGNFTETKVDRVTGEVLWDANDEIMRLKKAFSYGSIFMTYKPVIQSGQLFDETLYSPYGDKQPEIAQRSTGAMSDASVYGGYIKARNAYYVAANAMSNGKKTSFIARIPAYLMSAERHTISDDDIMQYLRTKMPQYNELSIIAKIPQYTQVEIEGHRYWLTGSSVNCGLIIPAEEINGKVHVDNNLNLDDILTAMEHMKTKIDDQLLINAYQLLVHSVERRMPLIIGKKDAEKFMSATSNKKIEILSELAEKASGQGQSSKRKKINLNKINAVIFQSVTGMNEQKIYL